MEFAKPPHRVYCLQGMTISTCAKRIIPGQSSLKILSSNELIVWFRRQLWKSQSRRLKAV
jgi:hypothetical protein